MPNNQLQEITNCGLTFFYNKFDFYGRSLVNDNGLHTIHFDKNRFLEIISNSSTSYYTGDDDDDELFLWYGWPTKGV